MLTFTELRELLGVTKPVLSRLVGEGLPFVLDHRRQKRFERAAVDAWLVEQGYAEVEQPDPPVHAERVCLTYADLAEALGMQGRDPVRVIAGWAKMPGFPGRAGSPGRRDAYLPVDSIRRWAASQGAATNGGGDQDEELLRLRLERERLKLEREVREELLQAERLADVDEVGRVVSRSVANAKAVLEPLPDMVLSILPATPPDVDEWPRFLRSVHAGVQQLLDDAYTEIAEALREDEAEEDEEE